VRRNVKLVVLENLLIDVILGQDFLEQHELVKMSLLALAKNLHYLLEC